MKKLTEKLIKDGQTIDWTAIGDLLTLEPVMEDSGLALLVQNEQPAYEDDVFGVPSCCLDKMIS